MKEIRRGIESRGKKGKRKGKDIKRKGGDKKIRGKRKRGKERGTHNERS